MKDPQPLPGEKVLYRGKMALYRILVTDARIVIASPPSLGADVSLPLDRVQSVEWRRGLLGGAGTLKIHAGEEYEYRARNKQGETAADAINAALLSSRR